MIYLNKPQQIALKAIYDRDWPKPKSYFEFRRSVQSGWDCVMVEYCGMLIGIEKDGYSHT